MRRLVQIALLGTLLVHGCKDEETKPKRLPSVKETGKSVKDQEVERIIVLNGAIDRLEKELTELERATPRDEAAIEDRRKKLEAVRATLKETERRVREMETR